MFVWLVRIVMRKLIKRLFSPPKPNMSCKTCWKTMFLLQWSLFKAHSFIFRGGIFHTKSSSAQVSADWHARLQMCPLTKPQNGTKPDLNIGDSPGFGGFDSGSNLQPWHGIFFIPGRCLRSEAGGVVGRPQTSILRSDHNFGYLNKGLYIWTFQFGCQF